VSADSTDRSVQFIAKLVQLTQDRKMRWQSIPHPNPESSGSAAYSASIEGKELRIYKTKREVLVGLDAIARALGREEKRRVTQAVTILEILDDFGQAAFTFDHITGLNDLYQSAAYSASRVDDLMDAVLKMK